MLPQDDPHDSDPYSSPTVSRRGFLRLIVMGVASAGLVGVDVQQAFARSGAPGLADWNASTFAARLGKSFTVDRGSAGSVALKLIQVKDGNPKIYHGPEKIMTSAPAGQSYVLVFRGPAEPALAQNTYSFNEAQLGDFAFFIVPGSGDSTGRNYIAVVNHIKA